MLGWARDGVRQWRARARRLRARLLRQGSQAHVAPTDGLASEHIRDLMVLAVEHRFARVNQLPVPIEWLSDNASCYIARETRCFAADIGLASCTTPVESPQSNGMAEAFGKTLKCDDVRVSPKSNAKTVLRQLSLWLHRDNTEHPHKALGYRSPRESIDLKTR